MHKKTICIYILLAVLLLVTACSSSIDLDPEDSPDWELSPDNSDTFYEAEDESDDPDDSDEPDDPDSYESSQDGTLIITITDSTTGLPLPSAGVFVEFPDEPLMIKSDENGIVTIIGLPGSYNIYAYLEDYLPREQLFNIVENSTIEAVIALENSQLITTHASSKRLTLNEIAAENINLTARENRYQHSFEVTSVFMETPLPNRSSTGNDTGESEIPSANLFLKMNCSSSLLGEFFIVQVVIKNEADPNFVLADGVIKLNLPQGLSLPDSIGPQLLEINLGLIQGGEEVSHSWIVYGDKIGVYNITLDYTGTLMPFRESVGARLITQTPIIVRGALGFGVNLQPFSAAIPGAPFYIPFTLRNNSNTALDMVTFEFNGHSLSHYENNPVTGHRGVRNLIYDSVQEMENAGIFQDGDSITIISLNPNEEINGIYMTWVKDEANPYDVYFELKSSAVQVLTDNNVTIPVIVKATDIEISIPSSTVLRMLENYIISPNTRTMINTNTLFSTNEFGRFTNTRGEALSENNYNHNRMLDFGRDNTACSPDCVPSECRPKPGFSHDGFIIDQTRGIPGETRMGRAIFGSNACGWVAAYNSFIVLGQEMQDKHPAEIIRWIESNNALVWDGNFGTNPAAFDRLFSDWDIKSFTTFASQGIFSTTYLNVMVQASTSSILNYINKGGIRSGIHNVTVVWDDETTEFIFYNVGGSNESRPVKRPTIDAFLIDYADMLISLTQVFN